MKVFGRSLTVAIALATAGCGSAATTGSPSATGTNRVSASSSHSQAPTTCGQATLTSKLAVMSPLGVGVPADAKIYSRDQPSRPLELCSVSRAPRARFVTGSMISFVQIPNFTPTRSFTEWDSHLVVRDSKDGSSRSAMNATGNIWDFDWAPDGQTVSWGLQSRDGFQLWAEKLGAVPKALTAMLVMPPRGYFAGDGNGIWIRFSPSGRYLVMANTLVVAKHLQIFRTSDWSLLWSADKGGSPLWSRDGNRLYFEDFAGEHAWQPDTSVSTVAPDGWLDPTLSPDGCCVAYTLDYATNPHVEVRDLRSGARQQIEGMHAAYPVFASSDVVWLAEMTKTGSGEGAPPYTSSGIELAYNLRSHDQARLPYSVDGGAILSVDLWPR